MSEPNRNIKDVLFRFIFGREENKKNLLELYNALNNSHYTNPNEMELTTLENVVYMNIKNDISFLFGFEMTLYEHQSTFSPNMPLRGLLYFSSLYDVYLEKNHLRNKLYRDTKVTIPTPRYIVFYNGTKELPDTMEMKLSEMFEKKVDTGCEWTATLININAGKNKELMSACEMLRDYAEFVQLCRQYGETMGIREGTVRAAEETIAKHNTLYDIFSRSKAEVIEMFLTDFNQEEYDEELREEGREEGRAAQQETILDFLAEHGEITEELAKRICEEESISVLKAWIKLAARVESIEEFWEKIQADGNGKG